MKIIAINGSHRGRKGYTQFLINVLFEGAESVGAQCETIVLAEKAVNRCTGCFSCQRQERLMKCIYDEKDDTQDIFNNMREADIIIFATPVYVFQLSSLLLNLLNRYPSTANCSSFRISKKGLFFHNIDEQLCSKPFATIICQDNLEYETHKNILSYFKTYSAFMDAEYVGSLVRRSGTVAGRGRDESKILKYPVLNDIYEAFRIAGKELVINGKISHSTEKTANKKLVSPPIFAKFMSKFNFFRKIIEVKSKEFLEG